MNAGYHDVVVEGTLCADRYGGMLAQLRADHRGPTDGYYLDVPFAETLARRATEPIAGDVNERQLRGWRRPRDLLPGSIETVIGADSALHETVDRIALRTISPAGPRGVVRAGSFAGEAPAHEGNE